MKCRIGKILAACLLAISVIFIMAGEKDNVLANNITGTLTEEDTENGTEEQKPNIKLSKTKLTMAPATTQTLKLNGAAASKVTWSSSKKSVASVNKSGKITAKTKGTAKIKAKYNGKTYTCEVTVKYAVYTAKDGMKYKDASDTFGRTGRWFKKSISGGKYYFTNTSGSAFYFKVTGSKDVTINFVQKIAKGTPYFAYSVDGGSMKRQKISNGKISVGNTKTHYVRVLIDTISQHENRWGEAGVGVKSIKPAAKEGVVTAIKPQNKTIAFYGDSITEGVRVFSRDTGTAGASAANSYAWYCAAKLKMVPYYAGYGGTGIMSMGTYNTCYSAITNFSSGRKASKFDADVIVVEHGTNDVHATGSAFAAEYRKVLKKLHKEHPDAQIYALIPMTGLHESRIRQAAKGLNYCTVVETKSWGVTRTDSLHPNVKGAKTMGQKLASKIKAEMK